MDRAESRLSHRIGCSLWDAVVRAVTIGVRVRIVVSRILSFSSPTSKLSRHNNRATAVMSTDQKLSLQGAQGNFTFATRFSQMLQEIDM